ncbi:retrovirus-related pol polyprotein from transposon TNT 1-94 [Tanacetum coccineum]
MNKSLEAHYSYNGKVQEFLMQDSGTDTKPFGTVETDESNITPDSTEILTKKPTEVPISTRKPKSQANKSVATPHKKTVASESTITNSKSYYRMLYKKTNKAWKWWIAQQISISKHGFTTSKVLITIFSLVGQFCDADLEVAFRKSTCFVRDLQGNDLLTGNRGTDLYTISLQETTSSTPICLMAKASPTQAWLWHRRLSHLNFDYINLLSKKDVVIGLPKTEVFKELICSSCEVSTAKTKYHSSQRCFKFKSRVEFASNDIVWSNAGLLDQMGRIYSEICKAPVISVRTGRGTEFLNKTLNVFFKEEGIEHQTSTPRTPEQNCVVERQNRTLVEAARCTRCFRFINFLILLGCKQFQPHAILKQIIIIQLLEKNDISHL